MNAETITEAARATLLGTLPFPKIVEMLIEAGVQYYHVDYVGRSKSFYNAGGDRVVTPITYEQLPPVAAEFKIDDLKAAILDSQQKGQKYFDFSVRAMKAGVQSYYAFLHGQRVVYLGRNGDVHTEWFPGVKIKDQSQ